MVSESVIESAIPGGIGRKSWYRYRGFGIGIGIGIDGIEILVSVSAIGIGTSRNMVKVVSSLGRVSKK